MNANDMSNNHSAEAIDLWRRLLKTQVDLEDPENGKNIVGDLDSIDENELAFVAAFKVDLEKWRIEASASTLALARDVGSLAETVEVPVPKLRAKGFGDDVVEFECDLDNSFRIYKLTVMIPKFDETRPLILLLIEPDGRVHTARVSSLGVAEFSPLAIEPTAGVALRFELRELLRPAAPGDPMPFSS